MTAPSEQLAEAPTSACDAAPATGIVPLVALLGRSEAAFIAEFDRRIKETEFCALSLAHSRNVLRHLGGGPQRASQFVSGCGVTKQALSQQIKHLEQNGYLTVEPDPADQRARVLTLTAKGERAQVLVKRLFSEIEDDWAAQIGTGAASELRRILERLLETVPERRC